MTFHEAEQFLSSLSNLPRKEFARVKKNSSPYLKRMQAFLDILGNPECSIPHVIHVGGTSGKGSVSIMLSSILKEAGYKTGLTISPPIWSVTERFQINGVPISHAKFIRLIEQVKVGLDRLVREKGVETPSLFETTSAIAFLYFAQESVDYAVWEVGLGGRHDPGNLFPHKDACVITNIGMDHMEFLGKTKKAIAGEKAGIIRRRVPTFTMEKNDGPLTVIKKQARKAQSPFHVITPVYTDVRQDLTVGTSFVYNTSEYHIHTLGEHQIENSILSINVARSLHIAEPIIKKGLAHASLRLRMEVITTHPLIFLDGAHNQEKIQTSVETVKRILASSGTKRGNVHLILGFSHDKPIEKMLHQLSMLSPKSIACTRNTIMHSRMVTDPRVIAKSMKKLCKDASIELFSDPKDAFLWSKKHAKKDDLILVTGSIFLGGELRKALLKISSPLFV